MPTRVDVIASVIDAVKSVQAASGRPMESLGETTALFDDIDGFDSLNGLEVLVMVGDALGEDLPENILAPRRDGSSATVGEVADRILKRMEGDKGDT